MNAKGQQTLWLLAKYKEAESMLVKLFAIRLPVKAVVIILVSSLLSACGFHLREDYLVPDEISDISVTSFDRYSQLTRNLDAQLRLNGINIVSASGSVPNIHLASESVSERTLSLYQNSRAAEKELKYTTTYRVTVPNRGTESYTTTVTRNYLSNSQTALAKSVERDLIEDEMRLQAARQIIRQMARLKAQLDGEQPILGENETVSTTQQPNRLTQPITATNE